MNVYPYREAKSLIVSLCEASKNGDFATRNSFFDLLKTHPDLAVQGYNVFGKIFFWNEASRRLYGYTEKEAINEDLFDLILPLPMRQLARDMIASGAKTGKMPEANCCDLVHQDGHYVTVYSGHVMFKWEDSAVPEFYCVDLPTSPDTEGDIGNNPKKNAR